MLQDFWKFLNDYFFCTTCVLKFVACSNIRRTTTCNKSLEDSGFLDNLEKSLFLLIVISGSKDSVKITSRMERVNSLETRDFDDKF